MNLSDYTQIQHLAKPLTEYVLNGHAVGGFLSAVLSNNLQRSIERADAQNLPLIPVIVSWLYNEAPSDCWGSFENYNSWSGSGGYEGKYGSVLGATSRGGMRNRLMRSFGLR